MSSLFSGINARFRGPSNKAGTTRTTATTTDDASSPTTIEPNPPSVEPPRTMPPSQSAPRVPPLPRSPSLTQSIGLAQDEATVNTRPSSPLPIWLHSTYSKHVVRGNFMALSAKPKTVEMGDWMAHQVVEHYRLLWNFVRVVYENEPDGESICNPTTCPTMSAGRRLEPTEIPAHEYMSLMKRWISGKMDDDKLFPTNPSTVSFAHNAAFVSAMTLSVSDSEDWVGRSGGFPKEFANMCKTIFLQMFRVYAHLYCSHFVDPFYHLNLEKQLNSCFSHFLLTATSLDMLRAEDLEPVQMLVDLWAANGTFPPESKAYSFAHVKSGEKLMQCGLEAS